VNPTVLASVPSSVPWVDAGIALTAYDIYNLIQPDALWHYA
jgi:hypothetical protein